MKKLLIIFLLLFAILINFRVFASDDDYMPSGSEKLKKEIKDALEIIYSKEYGHDGVEKIYGNVMLQAQNAINNRPKELIEQDITRSDDWYKNEIIYMFYVDSFGVVSDEKKNTFKDSSKMFDYLEDLGVTTLYMLPFADSPMKDAGFDVKNPQAVRRDLGGMTEFKDFVNDAKRRGFKIKADLVLNHLSDDHYWFKNLTDGNLEYLDYFIYRETPPTYTKYEDEKLGTIIEYKEDDGSVSKRRLIFPDSNENHYRKVTINNKDYYLYHTFYPFQLDLNWQNPLVLYYELETISKWANNGVDIFRLDAVPYLSKDNGTNGENQPKTHAIISLISSYIQLTAPSSVLQVEACQMPKDILPYFGKERTVDININGKTKTVKRTNEAQIAYNFPYMPALWASFITEDKKYFMEAQKNTPPIPKTAVWAMFLRLHDELTLEMAAPEVRKIVFTDLVNKGANFRQGFGVSGRLANFLDKNPNRIEMAFSVLLSLPGVPIIYYGDEIGASNNFENARKSALLRQTKKNGFMNLLSAFDSRDINRGNISQKVFFGSTKGYYEFNSKVYKKIKNLIELRKKLPVMTDGDFQILKTSSKNNLAYIRKNQTQQVLVVNNLSKNKLTAEITFSPEEILKNKGHITELKNLINNDKIKVNISLQNRTMHLRLAPYQVIWVEL